MHLHRYSLFQKFIQNEQNVCNNPHVILPLKTTEVAKSMICLECYHDIHSQNEAILARVNISLIFYKFLDINYMWI